MSLVKSASTPHLRGILERNPSSSSITDAPAPPLPRPQMTRSVSFAPLPDINKKKKKGSRPPLGIASRGAIIRKRMRHYDSPFPDDYPNSNGTIITLQGADGAAGEHLEKLRQLRSPDSGLGHPDPVVEFGRIVKEAGRNFWRKLSTSDSSHAITPSNGQPEPEGDSANHPQACIAAAKCEVVMEPRIQVVGPDPADDLYLHSENRVEGGVWEEEVGERYQRPYSTEKTLPPPPPRAYSPDSSVTTSPSQASDCSSAVSIPESPASEIDDTPHLPRFPMIEDPSLSLLTKEAASTQPLVSDVHHEQIHKLSIPVNQ